MPWGAAREQRRPRVRLRARAGVVLACAVTTLALAASATGAVLVPASISYRIQGTARPAIASDAETGLIVVAWATPPSTPATAIASGVAVPGVGEQAAELVAPAAGNRSPSLSWAPNGGGVLAAWIRFGPPGTVPVGGDLVLRTLSPRGAPTAPERTLAAASLADDCVTQARDPATGNALLAWMEYRDPQSPPLGVRLVAQLVTAAGDPVSTVVELGAHDILYGPLGLWRAPPCSLDVAWNHVRRAFVVGWSDARARAAAFGTDGALTQRIVLSPRPSRRMALAVGGDGTTLAVFDGVVRDGARFRPAILTRRIDAAGAPAVGTPIPVVSLRDASRGVPRNADVVARQAGGFVVVWDSGAVYGRLLRSTGRPAGPAFAVSDGGGYDPSIVATRFPDATSRERYVVAWTEPSTALINPTTDGVVRVLTTSGPSQG